MGQYDTPKYDRPRKGDITCRGFDEVIRALKCGFKAYRAGWNGKDQYISIGHAFSYVDCDGKIVNPNHENIGADAIIFHGTSGEQVGWLASQADMLATDWSIFG